jgi:arginine/ornithine N-succinyltransferase beta subunit
MRQIELLVQQQKKEKIKNDLKGLFYCNECLETSKLSDFFHKSYFLDLKIGFA